MVAEPDEFLPLRPVELEILVALRGRSLHGYGILQDAEQEGRAVPGLVTLYRALKRMEDRGLIERTAATGSVDEEDERRRSYGITPLGMRVLRAEGLRLTPLVRAALEASAPVDEGDVP